ncbi:hypothetical protein DXT99_02100 [Pontibacter diazotrophicus]|uniref:Uncharacterized protein n=1 Tax=Pontibacter diazotrophicus TaxID=1400979 RepID=A0A3D8LHJ8_9BACT|nr:hypothetical protein DXT99_02100 [Pontibacter diazotrophicus]
MRNAVEVPVVAILADNIDLEDLISTNNVGIMGNVKEHYCNAGHNDIIIIILPKLRFIEE